MLRIIFAAGIRPSFRGDPERPRDKVIDGAGGKAYNSGSHLKLLRGWVKFPTGGIARELNESSADPVMIPEPTVQSG